MLGPFFFGLALQVTGDIRWSVLSILIFFLAGGAILTTVNEKKGIAEAA